MSKMLTPDAQAPALKIHLTDGSMWSLADQKPANFTMIVLYRGYHCPICKSYLGTLQSLAAKYRDAGFEIVAVSMDTEERAKKAKDEWGLSDVPVGYGLTEAQAREWGAYVSSSIKEAEADVFAEPALFWVRPDGRLYLADVSNMPFARPDLEFLLSKVQMVVDNGYPARGTKGA